MTKLEFISKRKTTTRLKSHIHKLRQALRRNPDHSFFLKCDHRRKAQLDKARTWHPSLLGRYPPRKILFYRFDKDRFASNSDFVE